MSPVRAVLLLLLAVPAAAGDPAAVLKDTLKTEHFDLHVRPGSRAAAAVERTGAAAERDLVRITETLALKRDARFRLFLYDDLDELARITGVSGTGGFSSGDQCHIPWDDDQTRLHELVHVVAVRIPKAGDDPRNLFFAEGLANAVLEHVHGVPVHAVAAFYRKRKELPPLAEMTGAPDFYAWLRARPGFNAYDVAGSWLLHLLREHGAEKVKRYYAGMAAKRAFGADEAALERAWHAALDRFVLRPEVETLLRQRAGEKVEFPRWEQDYATVLGSPGDWTPLEAADLRPGDAKCWSRDGGAITGRSEGGEWAVCEFGQAKHGDAAVRVRVDLSGGCGALQVRLGPGCQGMLVANGAFVWRDAAGTASNAAVAIGGRTEVDLLLLRRGGTAEVWVDGRRAVSGPCGTDAAPPGVGLVGGRIVVRQIAVRPLK
ncbi:MAG TPA: hypothetical protein VFS92_00230 [Planctomycetota bacterium]|nr:hypothetical protein [Planctomycetota bacterium]